MPEGRGAGFFERGGFLKSILNQKLKNYKMYVAIFDFFVKSLQKLQGYTMLSSATGTTKKSQSPHGTQVDLTITPIV